MPTPVQEGGGPYASGTADHPDATLSSWILHPAGDCCGPADGKPIASELYLRCGPAFNIRGHDLNGALQTGLDINGGFRVSFFNQEANKAWVIDLGLRNVYNSTRSPGRYTLINTIDRGTGLLVPAINVTPESLNRTYFDYGLGREWYLWGSEQDESGPNWRIGADFGGRWGTAKMRFDEIRRRTGSLYGLYAAIHSDIVYPWHCYNFTAGLRLEWDYTWMHILQGQNDANLSGVNLLVTSGIIF